jgi:hypothetical protein
MRFSAEKVFAIALLILQGGAGLAYLRSGNLGKGLYWTLATALAYVVFFIMK